MKVLVTGTTGWLGGELAKRLASSSNEAGEEMLEVVGLSRRATSIENVRSIEADITSKSDMDRLRRDETENGSGPFDVVVHLAAVAGWCTLEQGLDVNVCGTQNLLAATLANGADETGRRRSSGRRRPQKFIVASSVGVTGSSSPHCPPRKLPIGPDQGLLEGSTWPYAFSKSLVEDLVKFTSNSNPDVDFITLRIGGVVTDPHPTLPLRHLETAIGEEVVIRPAECTEKPKGHEILPEMPLLAIALSDMMRCFDLAVRAPHRSGVRVITAVGPTAYSRDPVPDVMESWYGKERARGIDMDHHRKPGNEFDPIYDTEVAREELGFVAEIDLRKGCL